MNMMTRIGWVLLLIVTNFGPVWAQSSLEKKAQSIEKQLIAPCCWAKTVDQEQSQVAIMMKQEIRRRLAAGQSVEQIYAAFENEFGERVLASPKAQGFNWTVWIFPFVIMLLGAGLLTWAVRRYAVRKNADSSANGDQTSSVNQPASPLSQEDQAYLDKMDRELYRAESKD